VLFALALLDACIIGAAAVSLSTAYAVSDVLDLRHSLHRKPTEAKAFYAVYCLPIALGAALVLTPDTPLGFLTNAVQTLAGVLLPGATVKSDSGYRAGLASAASRTVSKNAVLYGNRSTRQSDFANFTIYPRELSVLPEWRAFGASRKETVADTGTRDHLEVSAEEDPGA
jgi:hypothetical protein